VAGLRLRCWPNLGLRHGRERLCARGGRRSLFVFERLGAAGGGVDKIQHRLEIGVIASLNNFSSQPFDFTGDIGRKMLLSCARRSHFSKSYSFPDTTAFFDFPCIFSATRTQ
jgi:hypothetical protein